MLDRSKLFKELDKTITPLLFECQDQRIQARMLWDQMSKDEHFLEFVQSKKWGNNMVFWQGMLSQIVPIVKQDHPYQILAVDGSQIYYDRHQGPACFLINVGTAFFNYTIGFSDVFFDCEPFIFVDTEGNQGVEFVNQQRDQLEHRQILNFIEKEQNLISGGTFCVLHDGLLIYSSLHLVQQKDTDSLKSSFDLFLTYADKKILHAGYVSLPSSTYLVQLLEIAAVKYQKLAQCNKLSDVDIASFFLQPHTRSVVFEVKTWISYLYPAVCKPYICFVHVGSEIVRLELPAWIAIDDALVDSVCAMVLDQVQKGSGYPISLVHAHQQAVVSFHDRAFFYQALKQLMYKKSVDYHISQKSLKKLLVDF